MGDSFETAAELSDNTELGPVIAVVGGGIAFEDGDFFILRDLSGLPYKLEFDSDLPESLNDTTAIPIPFQVNDSQAEVSRAIVQAINTNLRSMNILLLVAPKVPGAAQESVWE